MANAAPRTETHTFVVEASAEGHRLDVYLHDRLPAHSRTYLKDMVRLGCVTVDGKEVKPSHRVECGQAVVAQVVPRPADGSLQPQEMPLQVLYEDATLMVIDKPAGLVVHPGNGRQDQTLANGLAFHVEHLSDLSGAERPGIVHRLDRDTSGVMVVAKTNASHFALASQFQERTVQKEYVAVVEGEPRFDGELIDQPLARSQSDKNKMVVDPRGKVAQTRYEVMERFDGMTLLRCFPKTGRTHQIRVHLQHIGHPIVGDAVYGRRPRVRLADLVGRGGTVDDLVILDRQALHAHRLSIFHPLLGQNVTYEAPVPADMQSLLSALRTHRRGPARRPR